MRVFLITSPFLHSYCTRAAKDRISSQAASAGIRTHLHFLAAVQQGNTSSYRRAAATTGANAPGLQSPGKGDVYSCADVADKGRGGVSATKVLWNFILLRAIPGPWERCILSIPLTVFRSNYNILWKEINCPALWDTTALTSSDSPVSPAEVSGVCLAVAATT